MSLQHESKLRMFSRFVFAGAALLSAAHVQAAPYALSPDGSAVVRVTPSTSLGSGSFDASLITAAYTGWTVNQSAAASGGSVTLGSYDAGWKDGLGGAKLTATYAQSNNVAAGSLLHWVQVIDTNLPIGGVSSPYLDPRPNDDSLPFYLTPSEQLAASTGKTTSFYDFSRRDPASLSSTNPITWNALLYQVEYDGNTSVTVRDGLSWGWNMKPATPGSAKGSFVNPAPACPPATCSGLGGNTVTWGVGEPGSLSFVGSAYAPKVGEVFKVGTLTYHNGATRAGSSIDGVDLDIAMSFDNVAEENFIHHTRLSITNTPNTSDPVASADYVAFVMGGFSATFNVLESQTASVDLMATLDAVLDLGPGRAGLEPDKDLTTEPDAGPPVSFRLHLVGFASPGANGFVVPEPSNMGLTILGLTLLGWVRRRA